MADYISGNRYLTMDEMKINVTYLVPYFRTDDNLWTFEAIAGMLGNMQSESTINPGIWQSLDPSNPSRGFGIVQWTPSTKWSVWAAQMGYAMDSLPGQCDRIKYELNNGLQWVTGSTYPMTFKEFVVSTESPYTLGMTFLYNYEQPGDLNQPWRGTQAEFWYEFITGLPPQPPGGTQRKLPIWMYGRLF